jgi:hypothetical protein
LTEYKQTPYSKLLSMLKSWLEKNVSAKTLFWFGLAFIFCFMLQDNLLVKSISVFYFIFLAVLAGRKLKLIRLIIVSAGVILFNLFQPAGKVLFYVVSFPVTKIALESGSHRALTVVGLVYISFFCIKTNLNLPGFVGRLLSRTFSYFNQLVRYKWEKGKGIIENLDSLFFQLKQWEKEPTVNNKRTQGAQRTRLTGFTFLILILLVLCGLTVLSLLGFFNTPILCIPA